MPVTARLSRKFYEAFGEDVTNELVDWFNAVDLTYRADLRDLNEMNFARADATLERRVAELDTRFERRWAQLDARFDRLEVSVDAKLEGLRVELIKWMFLFWVGSVGLALSINAVA